MSTDRRAFLKRALLTAASTMATSTAWNHLRMIDAEGAAARAVAEYPVGTDFQDARQRFVQFLQDAFPDLPVGSQALHAMIDLLVHQYCTMRAYLDDCAIEAPYALGLTREDILTPPVAR